MSTATATKPATVKETAAALRKALRETFPGTKFSVRMSPGTGHGWLHVTYTDGPTTEAVRAVTDQFESSRFDGMDDAYHQTANQQWSCRGVNTFRSFSQEAIDAATPLVEWTTDGEPYIETEAGSAFARYPQTSTEDIVRAYLHSITI